MLCFTVARLKHNCNKKKLMDLATLSLLVIFVRTIHISTTLLRQDTACKMSPTLSLSSLPSNILFNFLDKGLLAGGPPVDTSGDPSFMSGGGHVMQRNG